MLWPRSSVPFGCVFPAPGPAKPTTILTVRPAAKPEGYQSVLTKEQWIGVLDFRKRNWSKTADLRGQLCRPAQRRRPWNPSEAEKIFALSKEYGVPIDAAEFMNEPNMLQFSGAPAGYTAADYARDQDVLCLGARELSGHPAGRPPATPAAPTRTKRWAP